MSQFDHIKRFGESDDIKVLEKAWRQCAILYKKKQIELMPLEDELEKIDFEERGRLFVMKELKDPRFDYERRKLRERIQAHQGDIPELITYCSQFYALMHNQRSDFQEQKIGLLQDKDVKQGRTTTLTQSSKDSAATTTNLTQVPYQDARRDARRAYQTIQDRKLIQRIPGRSLHTQNPSSSLAADPTSSSAPPFTASPCPTSAAHRAGPDSIDEV